MKLPPKVEKTILREMESASEYIIQLAEANECWASGLYACDPQKALQTIIAELTPEKPIALD